MDTGRDIAYHYTACRKKEMGIFLSSPMNSALPQYGNRKTAPDCNTTAAGASHHQFNGVNLWRNL
jgi:hypothetical protein